ncbi:uncharacterized protein CcaverHIS019_0702160 [Cutaneotrichosporon cavernicola]|uniref:Uncharacterized protein n=1 Tax=Cutaneotrichosporon cavernicola TaxID=279322 RepID=A0AA48L9Z2_9TREE|nr:uncharacterized protein CcaverHIS019_0702160 [Cutaneotrichosporon cavernicola]BEI94644.1 hypothetical protein CcaverHIS019_0702160 [Cutaneotrichosporon cavernicola]
MVIYIFLRTLIAFLGIIFFFIVILDAPEKAWFLDDREKLITRERLLSNLLSIDKNYFGWHQNRIGYLVGFYLVFPNAVSNIILLDNVITNVAGRTKKLFADAMFM